MFSSIYLAYQSAWFFEDFGLISTDMSQRYWRLRQGVSSCVIRQDGIA
jgi:hypothetical protein